MLRTHELLDRFELLYDENESIKNLRRAYIDQDLSSIFKLISTNDSLRKIILEKNLHELFRYLNIDDDVRKSILEKNLHSIFRILENQGSNDIFLDDFRKAVLEQNLHSLFRILKDYSIVENFEYEDLRKAVLEQNLHSIFRLLTDPDVESTFDKEDLRKAVTEQNLHSIFRLLSNQKISSEFDNDDLRKAVLEQNLHSIFRLYTGVDDLRKAVLEQNLHSIFRTIDVDEDFKKSILDQNIHSICRYISVPEDLRKSMIEENLNSIFRLTDADDDLRKFITQDNKWSLWKLLSKYIDTSFISSFKYLLMNKVDVDPDFFSRGQLKSKLWLISELKKLDLDLGIVFLCAGWYSTLATMLFESDIKIQKIRSFDIDPECEPIAERFNKKWVLQDWKFKATTKDILDIDYISGIYEVKKSDGTIEKCKDRPDTIINTSCEHIAEFEEWYNKIPKGKILILQANDFFEIDDHVNCPKSLEEFKNRTPMEHCFYEGELQLPKYKRFMRIGIR